jgi:hypothetical protein
MLLQDAQLDSCHGCAIELALREIRKVRRKPNRPSSLENHQSKHSAANMLCIFCTPHPSYIHTTAAARWAKHCRSVPYAHWRRLGTKGTAYRQNYPLRLMGGVFTFFKTVNSQRRY